MGFWKGLADKVVQKKEELEEEAKKRAAKKAAEMALESGKAAAKAAVKNAGKTLDYAGKKLEEALFGDASPDDEAPASARPGKTPSEKAPDPFEKLKADEAERKAAAKARDVEEKASARAREAREEARVRAEREVDDELAALKKKIRKS